jgi:RNA-directed DNA polymerase
MGLVARRVADARLLKLLRAFLNAGVTEGELVSPTEEGPLSPPLVEADAGFAGQGTGKAWPPLCYADDCNIYVRGQRAGERVLAGVEKFLEERLRSKSAVAKPGVRKFLGFSFTGGIEPRRRM